MGARRRGGSRTGTFLVLIGIAGVLTGTFVAGIWTGHHWPVLFGPAVKQPPVEAGNGKRGPAERTKPSDALPTLTFYDELKAPLTAPPPPQKAAKPGKPAPRPARPAEPAARKDETAEAPRLPDLMVPPPEPARPEPPAAVVASAAPDAATSRFTVQVAAYNARPPAEALRATLAASGHEARVVEAVTSTGVRYRVQVGSFSTRQAAQDAAARIGAERALATFVTTR